MAERKAASSRKKPKPHLSSSGFLDVPPVPGLARQKTGAASVLTIADHENLFIAIENFVRGNSNFESSIPVNAALEEIGKLTNLQEAFAIPLARQVFAMDAALRWVLFLTVAPARAEAMGDEPFPASKLLFAQAALEMVSGVYDIGLQETIWEHFEDEEDEGDEEDDEGDEEDEEEDAPAAK